MIITIEVCRSLATALPNSMTIKRFELRTISASVAKLTKPIFGKRGFGQGSIVTEWPAIAGETLAHHTLPEKISYPQNQRSDGTLHLRIDSSALALELQHLEPQLIDRINTHFGYRAVASIKINQGPINRETKPEKAARTPLTATEAGHLEKRLEVVSDPDVKAALAALGEEIVRDNPNKS